MASNGFATVADGRQSPWKLWVGCAQAGNGGMGFFGRGAMRSISIRILTSKSRCRAGLFEVNTSTQFDFCVVA